MFGSSFFLVACTDDAAADPPAEAPTAAGALVAVSLDSRVGVTLDDLPTTLRDRAADELLTKADEFWLARAKRQLGAMRLRLTYRRYYSLLLGAFGKAQLPLPPEEQWIITLDGVAERTTIDGHDVVSVGFTFTSTLLTDSESPGESEPALMDVGGVWEEPFTLPVDPELLFQRTGYSCMREPPDAPNAVDAESALRFYDDTCSEGAGGSLNCHVVVPDWPQSCEDALESSVGRIQTALRFERLDWDAALADDVRTTGGSEGSADLKVLPDGLANNHIVYRYIADNSCTLYEGCVGGSGWRRLLKFDASLENIGTEDIHMGNPESNVLSDHHVFEYSECHQHNHFRFYGDFALDAGGDVQLGDKRAFCLLSTSRYINNETTALNHRYDSCEFQGIASGWGDDYFAGLECQWVDITDVDTTAADVTASLSFLANPERFLCEGTPVLDEASNPTFEPTEFTTEAGEAIDRPICEMRSDWDANNYDQVEVVIPQRGGIVTQPCTRGELGPRRDCGFAEQVELQSCLPGETVTLECAATNPGMPQLLRLCEASTVIGGGVDCAHADALATGVIENAPLTVSFDCPMPRGGTEQGGQYKIYGSPVFDADTLQQINCVVP